MRKPIHTFLAGVLCALLAGPAPATTPAEEAAGLESAPPGRVTYPISAPPVATRAEAVARLATTGLLLVPESTNDRVMAFDPNTGDPVYADFIGPDFANLGTPIHALLTPDGTTVLVSDQINDVVHAYDVATGAYNGVFAPAGGADTSILDNVRGMGLKPDGHLLVTVAAGANADAVAEFDAGGNYLGNFIASGAAGLDSPFDVLYTGSEYRVGGITSDAIHRYDAGGNPLADFAAIDSFPEQLALAGNGNLLVSNFSGTQEGVVEFNPAGGVVGIYNPAAVGGGYRGVYELGNGNLLTTNGSGVHEIDRAGNLIETKLSGVSARYIQYAATAAAEPIPALGTPLLLALGLLLAAAAGRVLGRRAD